MEKAGKKTIKESLQTAREAAQIVGNKMKQTGQQLVALAAKERRFLFALYDILICIALLSYIFFVVPVFLYTIYMVHKNQSTAAVISKTEALQILDLDTEFLSIDPDSAWKANIDEQIQETRVPQYRLFAAYWKKRLITVNLKKIHQLDNAFSTLSK